MKRAIPVLLLLLPLSACVSTSKFKAEQNRADKLDSALAMAEKRLETQKADQTAATAASEAAALKKQEEMGLLIKTGLDQLGSVQKSNKDLQESLEAKKGELTSKISTLIKEKDALSQKVADSAVENGSLRKQKDSELAALQKQLAEVLAALKVKENELSAAEQAKRQLEQAKEAELAQVKKNYEDLTTGLKSEISAGEVTITQLKGKLTVNMVDRILFDSGLAEVRSEGKKVLDRIGHVLGGVTDKDIRIEGHTDNKPIVGALRDKYATNWELSTSRATAVARYLQDLSKLDGKRLVAAGYGEFRPVAANDTPEHRAQNRRIEIVLVPRD